MPTGKLSAQSGHAYTDSLCCAIKQHPERVVDYMNPLKGGSKVTLVAKNSEQLLKAYFELQCLGIPCAIIVDQNHILPPHFDGNPIITALGIGPCTKNECKQITKKFRCV